MSQQSKEYKPLTFNILHLYFFYFVDKYYNTFSRRANVLYALTRQCWDGGWPRDILSFIRLSVLFLVIEESDYRNLFAETIWKWKTHTDTFTLPKMPQTLSISTPPILDHIPCVWGIFNKSSWIVNFLSENFFNSFPWHPLRKGIISSVIRLYVSLSLSTSFQIFLLPTPTDYANVPLLEKWFSRIISTALKTR